MIASTVQIEVDVVAELKLEGKEVSVTQSWVGSGVVYEKTQGLTEPVQSKILSANHVLETPQVGDLIDTPVGQAKVIAVLMVVRTHKGHTCKLEPLVLSVSDIRDVATGLAYCDAGRVAPIANKVPPVGARIYVSGHPAGIPVAIVTEGRMSGWLDGYQLVSAAAFGGNSGGPVFYDGAVVGLLVRASSRHHHIALATPLQSILDRIAETP